MELKIKRLSEARLGETAVIESFTDDLMKLKLMEMGCVPGETIVVDRFAPLGDPIAIVVATAVISLRLDEAAHVMIRPVN